MRLTTFTDYGLRVLIYLAAQPGRRATIAEIASSYGVSENHLMKVVHSLGKAGLLTNVRGRGGGLELARPPASINVAAVVRATEAQDLPAECFDHDHNTCPIAMVCRLARVLDEAMKAFYKVLEGYTLEDLVHNRKVLQKVLFIPNATKQRA